MSPSLYLRSLELQVFCEWRRRMFRAVPWSWFCFCHYVSARSLAVWCVFRFMPVSKRRWLICDSRWKAGKPAMAGNDTSWTVSRICLFEVFAEHSSARFPDKWKNSFRDTLVLEQALQTADYRTSESFVSTVPWTNWINLSPTKRELYYSHYFSQHAKDCN